MLKALEHKIKATVFNGCRLLLRKRRTDLTVDPMKLQRVIFLRPEKIGDMVISLPTFEALRKAYPHIKISVLASPGNQSLIAQDPGFDQVFLYRKEWGDIDRLKQVRSAKFDAVFDMIDGDSVTTLFYSQLLGRGAVRIGIGKEKHARYYDFNHVHEDGIGGHIVDNTLKLLEPLGIDVSNVTGFVPPYIPNESQERVDSFIGQTTRPEDLVLGLNLSAGRPNRIWPGEATEELCRRLLEEMPDLRLVLIATPEDRERGAHLLDTISDSRLLLVPDKLSLLDVSALISHLRLLISPDTSLIHIARSFRVPVVGLYNKAGKNFRRWQPYRQVEGAIVGDHIDTIFDITPLQVLQRVQLMLSEMSGVDR